MQTHVVLVGHNIYSLLLGIYFQQQSIDHRIIGKERHDDPAEIILYPRALEFLERCGLPEDIINIGTTMTSVMYHEHKIPFGRIPHHHALPRVVSRDYLYGRLREIYDGQIYEDLELVDYKSRANRINITLTDNNQKELISTHYLCLMSRDHNPKDHVIPRSLYCGHHSITQARAKNTLYIDDHTATLYSDHDVWYMGQEQGAMNKHHMQDEFAEARQHGRCLRLGYAAHHTLGLRQHDSSQCIYDVAHIAPQLTLAIKTSYKAPLTDRQSSFEDRYHAEIPLWKRLYNKMKKKKEIPDARDCALLDEYVELGYAQEHHCGWLNIAFMKYQTINILDYREWKKGPRIGHKAPHGHVVVESNQPKRHRKRLVHPYKMLFFAFVGSRSRYDEDVRGVVNDIQTQRGDIADIYVVTNHYDISKHDGNPSMLGDPDALLHETFSFPKPGMIGMTSDGVVCYRSCGIIKEEYERYFRELTGTTNYPSAGDQEKHDEEKQDEEIER